MWRSDGTPRNRGWGEGGCSLISNKEKIFFFAIEALKGAFFMVWVSFSGEPHHKIIVP